MKNRFRTSMLTTCVLITAWLSGLAVPALDAAGVSEPSAHWARVLKLHVNAEGQIDFEGLAQAPDDLQRFVDYIAVTSPESDPQAFPDPASKIAYYINSYNALAMYNVVQSGIPESLGGLKKIPFFFFRKFTVGGKRFSLSAYENDVIRAQGEERIHFALNCMVVGCPRLPAVPFTSAQLDTELERETRRFLSEPRNLRIDHEKKVVYLSWIMKYYKEDFLAKSPSLIDYVNPYLEETIPADYTLRFFDYDWTVNRQSGHPG